MSSIIIYSKNYCPYCVRAKQFFDAQGLSYKEVNIEGDANLQEQCFSKSNGQRTVPQIFIDQHHIGGFSDLMDLVQKGEFKKLIK